MAWMRNKLSVVQRAVAVMVLRTAVDGTRTYGGVRGAPYRLPAVGPSTRLCIVLSFCECRPVLDDDVVKPT